MLLLIDIGNTNIVLGVHSNEEIVHSWRLETARNKTRDEYALSIKSLFEFKEISFKDIEGVAISSVVPALNEVFKDFSEIYLGIKPLFIEPGIKTGVPILLDNPKEVGADRIANAVAAYKKYQGPTLIIDFGTATTFDVISEKGEYLGGVICPGPLVSAEALVSKTSKLSNVSLIKPEKTIGKSTVSCIQSGIYYGYLSQMEGLIARINKEMGTELTIVTTGGLAGFFTKDLEYDAHEEPFLTLEGLKLIYERNRGK